MSRLQPQLQIHLPVAIAITAATLAPSTCLAQDKAKPSPTITNFSYGPHERNVLDFWQAESDRPVPLVLFIHGGGFRRGHKESISASTLNSLLESKISVAALNYRFVQQALLPAAHYDCRRALQMLRSKAGEWGIDKSRVGAFGDSAGAQICMYLGFHDDMTNPDSADPLERESTRLACVATNGGQTTVDVNWWLKNLPEYKKPHLDFFGSFGTKTENEFQEKAAEVSALALISKDDPPIYMSYRMRPTDAVPSDPQQARNWKVHHVVFGTALKEKMDALGIEADLIYPGTQSAYRSTADFLIAKLNGPS